MSKNTEFAEKLAELVVREAELRSGRTDGYIKPEIAVLLGMHPRTMQRHLEAEGTTFETLR
jgi:hypothetical protein